MLLQTILVLSHIFGAIVSLNLNRTVLLTLNATETFVDGKVTTLWDIEQNHNDLVDVKSSMNRNKRCILDILSQTLDALGDETTTSHNRKNPFVSVTYYVYDPYQGRYVERNVEEPSPSPNPSPRPPQQTTTAKAMTKTRPKIRQGNKPSVATTTEATKIVVIHEEVTEKAVRESGDEDVDADVLRQLETMEKQFKDEVLDQKNYDEYDDELYEQLKELDAANANDSDEAPASESSGNRKRKMHSIMALRLKHAERRKLMKIQHLNKLKKIKAKIMTVKNRRKRLALLRELTQTLERAVRKHEEETRKKYLKKGMSRPRPKTVKKPQPPVYS